MSRTARVMNCTPEDVFDVFRDGWSYATWVVGAARIRRVEDGWPEVGTHIHHSVGMWPLLVSDNTEVEAYDPPRELRLKVRVWPGGEGIVTMRCSPRGPEQTEVVMEERLHSGPVSWLPNPVEDLFLHGRNVEALRRLAYLAERKARKD
jgi:hypothetical protein